MKGLCFSGGGIKIAAHIGALKAFEELGIQIDCISGTSSGSMAAVLYSIGCAPEEMKKIIYESYKGLVKTSISEEWTAQISFPDKWFEKIIPDGMWATTKS